MTPPAATPDLDALLEELVEDEEMRRKGRAAIDQAISEHREHQSPEIGAARSAMGALVKGLEASIKALDDLPYTAIHALCNQLEGPRGKASQALQEFVHAASGALENLQNQNARQTNPSRKVLAFRVAQAMRDHLHLEPAKTRDDPDMITGSRGGGSYARLLRLALELSGDSPPSDLFKLMSDGLKDAYGNNWPPTV